MTEAASEYNPYSLCPIILNMLFRKATKEEIPRIWEIILQAKAQMKRAGSEQWQDGYPTAEIIGNDIEQGIGFVICDRKRVIAYGAVSFDSEPAYEEIADKWQGSSYVVVHRLAVADECKHRGVAHAGKEKDLATQTEFEEKLEF